MTDSPDLYKPFGFRVLREHYFTASYMHEPGINTNVKKLDFSNEDDFQRITDIFHNKVRLSQYFAPISYWESFAYSSYYHEKLYLVEELDTVIVFEVKEDTLKLYDVVSAKLPILEDICTHIPYPFTKIELYFSPDQFTTIPLEPVLVNSQDCLMVRGPFSMEKGYFKFPITANF
jgi:hypothetical protein